MKMFLESKTKIQITLFYLIFPKKDKFNKYNKMISKYLFLKHSIHQVFKKLIVKKYFQYKKYQ